MAAAEAEASAYSASFIDQAILSVEAELDGISGLKAEQKGALKAIINGEDVLALLPTGFGKSLIVQALRSENPDGTQASHEECETDQDCIDVYGMGEYCCARVNSITRDLRQCKPIGQEGELCHVGSNYLPYPFRGARRFWRCQCNFPEGFWCAPDPTSYLPNGGRCERWVPPANTTSSTEDAGSG